MEEELKKEMDKIVTDKETKLNIIQKIYASEADKKTLLKRRIRIYLSKAVTAVILLCITIGVVNVVTYATAGKDIISYIKESIGPDRRSTKNMFDENPDYVKSNEAYDNNVIDINETICVDGCEITFIDCAYDNVLDNLRIVIRINDDDDYDNENQNSYMDIIDESQNNKLFDTRYSKNKLLFCFIERKEDELKEYYLSHEKTDEQITECFMKEEYLDNGKYFSIVIKKPYITDNHKINFNFARNEYENNIFLASYSLDMSKAKSVECEEFETDDVKATMTIFGLRIERSKDENREDYNEDKVFLEKADGTRIEVGNGLCHIKYDSIRKMEERDISLGYSEAVNPKEIEKIIVGDSVLTKLKYQP